MWPSLDLWFPLISVHGAQFRSLFLPLVPVASFYHAVFELYPVVPFPEFVAALSELYGVTSESYRVTRI